MVDKIEDTKNNIEQASKALGSDLKRFLIVVERGDGYICTMAQNASGEALNGIYANNEEFMNAAMPILE
jgi:hypothetical protein